MKKPHSMAHRKRNRSARYKARRKAKLRRARLRSSSGERRTYR